MINEQSLAAVEAARFSTQFMRPLYDDYAFARIPQTIRACLTDSDQKGIPFGAQLNAIYSSDIGHFDVIDFRDPLPEAYELVEDGHITEDNFRDFIFANSVRLWGTQNPDFFKGTVVEKEAAAVLAAQAQAEAPPAKAA